MKKFTVFLFLSLFSSLAVGQSESEPSLELPNENLAEQVQQWIAEAKTHGEQLGKITEISQDDRKHIRKKNKKLLKRAFNLALHLVFADEVDLHSKLDEAYRSLEHKQSDAEGAVQADILKSKKKKIWLEGT